MRLCALCEDIENKARSVNHRALQRLFKITLLTRAQLMIEYDQVGINRLNQREQFFKLTSANKHTGIGGLTLARKQTHLLGTGRAHQFGKLTQVAIR